jgi:hypothetical protein
MADEASPQPGPPPKQPSKRPKIYKPKNGLDGFLRFTVGGKYKYRRHEIFRDYLIQAHKKSSQEADEIIVSYKTFGVGNRVSYGLSEGLKDWMALCRKTKGKNAAKARWEKEKAAKKPKIAK